MIPLSDNKLSHMEAKTIKLRLDVVRSGYYLEMCRDRYSKKLKVFEEEIKRLENHIKMLELLDI